MMKKKKLKTFALLGLTLILALSVSSFHATTAAEFAPQDQIHAGVFGLVKSDSSGKVDQKNGTHVKKLPLDMVTQVMMFTTLVFSIVGTGLGIYNTTCNMKEKTVVKIAAAE